MTPRPTLGLVPLDERPVCLEQPRLLAQDAGYRVLTPPARLLGRFQVPGDGEAVARWLAANFAKADAWAVSLDMLAYGGLVASRRLGKPAPACLRPLRALSLARRLRPEAPVCGFQAIRRRSVTVSSRGDLALWRRLHEDDAGLSAHRRRNHLVNLAAVGLLADGALDWLLLMQEDATARGAHKDEQTALKRRARELGAADRLFLGAGTDEAAAVALARLDCALKRRRPRVKAVYSSAAGSRRIAPYEDRPLCRTLAGQVAAAGASLCRRNADLELWAWCPDRAPADHALGRSGRRSSPAQAERFCRAIAAALKRGAAVAVADVADANGADPEFSQALARRAPLRRLSGYAAWNTAGNALGWALAQGLLGAGSPRGLALRLCDDWGYQSVCRAKLSALAEKLGADPWSFDEPARRALERALRAELGGWTRRTLGRHFTAAELPRRFSLPWSRLFEARISWTS
ncbi:MAG: DUF4127 family protein [Elusimicrobia bacterium]|nr:DUF4127 family protein [Elusimicrobiota bacterium]MDE2237062.1 DUF4127 family protein [Elusimicrobiota bacterium]MDE2426092.1 DUF4127 family protein [Elusimicrobiota bacterium]